MRSATDVLRDEHRVILVALERLESAAERLQCGEALPDGQWSELLAWLHAFADERHHAKEENVLFPAMIKAGLPMRGGPVDVMLEEHAEGRTLVAAMAAGQPAQRAAAAHRYVRLLREHILKENEILFPLADAVLGDDAQAALLHEFAEVDPERGVPSMP